MSKSKKLTVNLSRDEVMAHEIGPVIVVAAKQCNIKLHDYRHVETLYRKNPNNDGVDHITSRFYSKDENIEIHTSFVDEGQRDEWELVDTVLDRYILEDDEQ